MAVIALTSARSAPGVTTTALVLTLVWPRPVVLVEADAAGSSSVGAGYLRGNLDPNHGLISFAVAHRAGELTTDTVREQALPLAEDDTKLFVPGLASADQVGSLTPDLWDRLGGVLAALDRAGTDVLVDAGRLGAVGEPFAEQEHDNVAVSNRSKTCLLRRTGRGREVLSLDYLVTERLDRFRSGRPVVLVATDQRADEDLHGDHCGRRHRHDARD